MPILDKVALTQKSKTEPTSPEGALRKKVLDALNIQIQAAAAMDKNETFNRRAKRWVDNPETGARELKDMPVRFQPWWWEGEDGKIYVSIKYGNRVLEIKPKKTSVEVGNISNLSPTLALLREAMMAGELDGTLAKAAEERKKQFAKRKSSKTEG